MQLTGHSTSQDLVSEVRFLCDATSTSYALADIVRQINAALEFLVGKIINADGTWEWDDTNYTDLPLGTGTLVEGQESYSFSREYLSIVEVDVADNDGKWHRLRPLSREDLGGLTTEDYFGTDSNDNPNIGFPEFYDIEGDSIRLFPAPTSTRVTLTGGTNGGIRIAFKRTVDLFTTSDTTQEPGLPSPYHILLAYYAAIPYCMMYKKNRVAWLEKKWDEGVLDVIKHYSHRERDRKKIMTVKKIKFR